MDWNPGFGEVDCEGNVDIIGYEQQATYSFDRAEEENRTQRFYQR